jgi:PTS system ascorbate-specific IIA component
MAAAEGLRARIVVGASVPMLWRTLCYLDQPLETLVASAVAGASQGVMQVATPRRQNQPSPPGRHDQVLHPHQQ